MLFREHKGDLGKSMETTREVDGREGLVSLMRTRLAEFGFSFPDDALKVTKYDGIDSRTGWDTHVVTIDGYGVAGFTNAPADQSQADRP